jgi:hypothetical protein
MTFLVLAWARAFALTTAVEMAVAASALGARWPWPRRLATVALAQLASHPAVWFVLPAFGWQRNVFLTVAESWATAVEAAVYFLVLTGLRWRAAFAISLLANAASVVLGLLTRALWPWF